jgi:hypothetical protein
MLFKLLFRILSGEPYRKATPAELRWYSAALVFLPIYMGGAVYLGNSFLRRASGVGVWLFTMTSVLVAGLAVAVWGRFVPTFVSAIVAVIVWIVAIWLAWHLDLAAR